MRRYESQCKWQYGMPLGSYDVMLEKQKGRCLICERHHSELKRILEVDHDHETGQIRGLLCGKCNVGIGHITDVTALLEAVIYLERAKCLVI